MGKRFLASKERQAKENGDKFRRLSMAYALKAAGAPQTRKSERKKSRRQRAREFSEGYLQYIRSDAWLAFRRTIFDARGRRCEQCQSVNGEFHLHHLTYKNLGREKPRDVKILCRHCHEALHQHMKKGRRGGGG